MKRASLFGFAILLAIVIGYLDTHMATDDNLPSVITLIGSAFVFSALEPRAAWLLALIFGCAVPAAHLIGLAFGYRPPYPVEPSVLVTFIALVPAFLGAGLGALVGFGGRLLFKRV